MIPLEELVDDELAALPPLPEYGDDENERFHPVAFAAAGLAFRSLERAADRFAARGQYATPAGPADMVIVEPGRDGGERPWIPVEIKKYRGDVRGKGRRQANDYRDNITRIRTQLYVSTNLELFEVFRFDEGRPSVVAQRLVTSFAQVGSLDEARADGEPGKRGFYLRLCLAFAELMEIALGERDAVYENGFYTLGRGLEEAYDELGTWHGRLLPVSFDIIRGSGVVGAAAEWKPSGHYRRYPGRMSALGRRVDFDAVFSDPVPRPEDDSAFDGVLLGAVHERPGDATLSLELASLVQDQVHLQNPGSGVVGTDSDLALLLARRGLEHLPAPLAAGDVVLDPCAGAGNLLVALADAEHGGVSLRPDQIRAIEKDPHFAEALSLRLGLAFSDGLSPENRPRVEIRDFLDVDVQDLAAVRLVLVNPPFQSRARSAASDGDEFTRFTEAIVQASNGDAQLAGGQHGLEKLFLELLCLRLQPGTTVAAVLPRKLVMAPGRDGDAFRRFLLRTFGLREMISYPSDDLFRGRTVETAILIGRVTEVPETSAASEASDGPVADRTIDFTRVFCSVPELRDRPLRAGAVAEILTTSRRELESGEISWRAASIPVAAKAIRLIRGRASGVLSTHRGRYGDQGMSRELAFPSNTTPALPGVALAVLQRQGEPPRVLRESTADEWTVPETAVNRLGAADLERLWNAIRHRARDTRDAEGRQKKDPKTVHDLPGVLRCGLVTTAPAVLVPRGQRAAGQISVFDPAGTVAGAVVSTNYIVAEQPSVERAKLVGSWLLSVFGQVMLEFSSKPERGLRKLELSGLREAAIPDPSWLDEAVGEQLIRAFDADAALSFRASDERRPRRVDQLWAEALFGGDGGEPGDALDLAFDALEALLDDRLQGSDRSRKRP